MRNKYYTKFMEAVNDDDMLGPDDVSPDLDNDALEQSFEDPERSDDFNTDPRLAGRQDKYIERVKSWAIKMRDFATWLNGTDSESLNKQLIDLDTDGGAFDGISAETSKVTEIATDLYAISERMNRLVLLARSPKNM